MIDSSTQFIVFDTEDTTLYEIHQDDKSLGGFDYTNQVNLSRDECSRLIRKLAESNHGNDTIERARLTNLKLKSD